MVIDFRLATEDIQPIECPFCGSNKIIYRKRTKRTARKNYYMECNYCGAKGPITKKDNAINNDELEKKIAISMWNKRAKENQDNE